MIQYVIYSQSIDTTNILRYDVEPMYPFGQFETVKMKLRLVPVKHKALFLKKKLGQHQMQ